MNPRILIEICAKYVYKDNKVFYKTPVMLFNNRAIMWKIWTPDNTHIKLQSKLNSL